MAANPKTRLGDTVFVLGITAISAGLQTAIADGAVRWEWVLGAGVVAVLAVICRDRFRPSIWTPWGRFWLGMEAMIVHPFDARKRAEYEYEQGFNDPEFDDKPQPQPASPRSPSSPGRPISGTAVSAEVSPPRGPSGGWVPWMWGIVAAVVAGLLVVVIVYVAGAVNDNRARRADLRVLCGLVGDMRVAFDDPQLDPSNPAGVPLRLIKRTVFLGFGERIEDALENALPMITYEERTEIRGIFRDAEIHLNSGDGSVEMYDDQLTKLEGLSWLTCS